MALRGGKAYDKVPTTVLSGLLSSMRLCEESRTGFPRYLGISLIQWGLYSYLSHLNPSLIKTPPESPKGGED